jgi:hypothetical protein
MSEVTNVLLSHDIQEGGQERGDDPCWDAVLAVDLTRAGGSGQFFRCNSVKETSGWGGSKSPEANLYAAAVNYFDLDGALERIAALPWEWPEHVQLFIKGNDELAFSVYELREGRFACVLKRHEGNLGI